MKTLLGRFWKNWMIIASPILYFGWATGVLVVMSHGYMGRELTNLAEFTLHKILGQAIATGLISGFWFALAILLVKLIAGHPRRERRTFIILGLVGVLALCAFAFYRLPYWKYLAANGAYDGKRVGLLFGVTVLAIVNIIQATTLERLQWISQFGMVVALATIPAAFIERRLFRREPKPRKARRWPEFAGVLCLLLNLIVFIPFAATGAKDASTESPHVIWISIDTLRADHLSVYGYERPTSPNLEALAADGIVVEQFISHSPWTLPTHAAMFSGLEPAQHGVTTQDRKFSPTTPLFPEILKERGYRNGAVATSLFLSPTFGYAAGFDKYEMNIEFNAETATNRAMSWLFASKKPSFLFLHLFDPHFPYAAPEPFLGRFGKIDKLIMRMQRRNFFEFMRFVSDGSTERISNVIARYDEEILFADHAVGMLIRGLKERGLYDRAWIIVVSDHGEEFLDHGSMGHSTTMYEEMMKIPLIIKAPGSRCAGSRLRTGQIPQKAVADMILAAARPEAEMEADLACDPEDGVPALLHKFATMEPILGESRVFGPVHFMVRTQERKLHSPVDLKKGGIRIKRGFELYDLAEDPAETRNIYRDGAAPDFEKIIAKAVQSVSEETGPAEKHKLDPATVQKLKSLGYLQ